MILTISKWGNSQGIRFPKDLLEKLHAKVGTALNVEYQDGKVIIEPMEVPKKFDIHELCKNITPDDKPKEVDWGKAEGNEIW